MSGRRQKNILQPAFDWRSYGGIAAVVGILVLAGAALLLTNRGQPAATAPGR